MSNTSTKKFNWTAALIVSAVFALVAVGAFMAVFLGGRCESAEEPIPTEPVEIPSYKIMEDFDNLVSVALSDAHDAAAAVKKVYWIP